MSLNASNCASQIWTMYCGKAALNSDGTPIKGGTAQSGFNSDFASIYNNYASDAIIPGTDNQGGDASILEGALNPSGSTDVTGLALAFAQFWESVAVIPGTPSHGGTGVVSVTNNAMAHVSDFESAIQSSITTTKSTPYFETFILNIESVVKDIIWTVIETMPPNGTPAPHQAQVQ